MRLFYLFLFIIVSINSHGQDYLDLGSAVLGLYQLWTPPSVHSTADGQRLRLRQFSGKFLKNIKERFNWGR